MGSNHADVLTHFWYFLTAYIHTVLYLRSVYPQTLFTRTRLHNAVAYQSRSPELCAYINDVIMSVHSKLLEGNVGRIGIVLYTQEDDDESIQARERYVLDVSTFRKDIFDTSDRACEKEEKVFFSPTSPESGEVHNSPQHGALDEDALPDLSEQLRATLIKLVTQVDRERLEPLAEPGWHVYMEARGEANPSDWFSDLWIPVSEAIEEEGENTRVDQQASPKKRKIVPIRAVDHAPISFQAYIEVFVAKE